MYLWGLLFLSLVFVLALVVMGFFSISFSKNGKKSNKLMVMRVAAQTISIIILFITWFVYKIK